MARLAVGAAIVVVGIVAAWFLPRETSIVRRWSILGFGVLWLVIASRVTLVQYLSLRHALVTGNYTTVEGPITEYRSLLPDRTGNESFVVDGHRFEFSEFNLAPGFKLTQRRGGPLRAGMYVRVAYRGDTILRLEICRP